MKKLTAIFLLINILFWNNLIKADQLAIDIAITAIVTPNLTVTNCLPSAPKLNIRNFGTSNQTSPFAINFEITGPVSYSSTRIATLDAGQSKIIIFDSTFAPSEGAYTAIAFISSATGDTNLSNDTLVRSFTVIQNHTGGLNDLYFYFANSTPCAYNSGYSFNWADTTGSTNLILNGQIDTSIAKFTGTLDNGYFSLGNFLPPGQFFKFFQVNYDSFFVSTNGIICFTTRNNSTRLLDNSPDSIPGFSNPRASIFALWKDLDYGVTLTGTNRLSIKYDGNLIITYDRAPNFGATSSEDYVSFQIILDLFPFYPLGGFIDLQYDISGTGSTFLSKYFLNTLDAHSVGIQDTSGTVGIEYRRVSGLLPSPQTIVAGPLLASSLRLTFGGPLFPFPVELTSFNAIVNERDVLLNWSTVSELNNSGFDIERSNVKSQMSDSWSKIGTVKGNGTSNVPKSYSFTDRSLNSGKYKYRLKQMDFNGHFEYFYLSNEVFIGIPAKFDLSQNYPNPFNPSTKINFEIPEESFVTLRIYNLSGKEIAKLINETRQAGYYTADFNGSKLSSGIYFYRMEAGSFTNTMKMIILK